MSDLNDLPQIRRRIAQLTTFEDGFWDLLLGAMFLFLSIYNLTRERLGPVANVALFLVVIALMAAAQLVLRRLVSEPRIGYVRSRRSPKLLLVLALTAGMVLITFGVLMLTLLSPGAEPLSAPATPPASAGRGYLVEIITLLAIGGLFSLLGYVFQVKRMYLYGWMLGAANLASVYMEHNAGWTFLFPSAIAAGIIFLIGLIRLARFLRAYPVPAENG
jgi:hypothetical protein